ncbi:MAG: HlyD family efflux transporter periplasmic adaptor subunit [Saprospiraceae bacterium]|nr:HlyD family efflux transporter periplasmic adaptor subunit [Saprospiraceae bacterium]MBK8671215.1 HlyD family efflux transporter periplasmic adaptor subunit [Saprospiraceae bacterium]
MLNISDRSISKELHKKKFSSFRKIKDLYSYSFDRLVKVVILMIIVIIVIMFMPWTQNVRAKGDLIALSPEQRPQTIQSVIAGRIEKWYVQEGQLVKKGDTILRISEVKDDYFDPDLLGNTQLQLDAKKFSRLSYEEKVKALENQIDALEKSLKLKISQAENKVKQNILKVTSDSIELQATRVNFQVANEQYQRFKSLFDEGLRSLTDLENRNLKYQESQAKLISQENKWLTSKNELINSKIELNSIQAEYKDKIAKANSDKFSALSGQYDTDASINKLKNQYNNYQIRNSFYHILAPQDGYVTQARQVGIGETIKEGAQIVSIMPVVYDLAIQMYIKPIDLPLFEKGQKVMIQFDGWPAIIFSGWPGISFGTYEGEVLAIDNFTTDNHMYRVLVKPKHDSHPWPTQLRVGAGIKSITLLKNVSVWYELWRQINGFPPDYYKKKSDSSSVNK